MRKGTNEGWLRMRSITSDGNSERVGAVNSERLEGSSMSSSRKGIRVDMIFFGGALEA